MFEVDGYEVLKLLWKNLVIEVIFFIFMIVKFIKVDLREGMELGVDDYLMKFFIKDELMKVINIRLDK